MHMYFSLVTNNAAHFMRINDLAIENWKKMDSR